MVDMSATIIHYVHIRLLRKAVKFVNIVVSLTKDVCLYLKKCEFKFNNKSDDMYQIFLKIFRNNPLKLS